MNRVLDRDVLLDFFLTFARYEFALKTGGFAKCGTTRGVAHEAQADWEAFAGYLSRTFPSSIDPSVRAACEQLIESPSWELVILNGGVMWQQQPRPTAGDLAADTLSAVRRLRNNLFHGNEASAVHGYVASHVEQLLRDAVRVLHASASLVPSVQVAYGSADL